MRPSLTRSVPSFMLSIDEVVRPSPTAAITW
jgi:hypothetical protein